MSANKSFDAYSRKLAVQPGLVLTPKETKGQLDPSRRCCDCVRITPMTIWSCELRPNRSIDTDGLPVGVTRLLSAGDRQR